MLPVQCLGHRVHKGPRVLEDCKDPRALPVLCQDQKVHRVPRENQDPRVQPVLYRAPKVHEVPKARRVLQASLLGP